LSKSNKSFKMESTYLCKVDERVLKLMVSAGATMTVIELESVDDFAKFNTIVRAMKSRSAYVLNKALELPYVFGIHLSYIIFGLQQFAYRNPYADTLRAFIAS